VLENDTETQRTCEESQELLKLSEGAPHYWSQNRSRCRTVSRIQAGIFQPSGPLCFSSTHAVSERDI